MGPANAPPLSSQVKELAAIDYIVSRTAALQTSYWEEGWDLGLLTQYSNFTVSYPLTLFFWHVNNSTKERKFLADNALLSGRRQAPGQT